ncbi:MAG: maleylpyruvate isomerase family mycothiol-dependent enzyme [Actinomycetes bacterium]
MTLAAPLVAPLTHLTELATAEACLAADLAGRDAEWSGLPSGLPSWSRAQLVGHLAGSARGLINLCDWAATGVETPMYPSPEVRAAQIAERAGLPWPDLVAEVSAAQAALATRLEALTEPVATRSLRLASGAAVTPTDIAALRIREIEIHRVDLAAEYQPVDWSHVFTLRTFSQLTPFFLEHRDVGAQVLRSVDSGSCWTVGVAGPDLWGTEADLLAWLIGRPHGPLRTSDGAALPDSPVWV